MNKIKELLKPKNNESIEDWNERCYWIGEFFVKFGELIKVGGSFAFDVVTEELERINKK